MGAKTILSLEEFEQLEDDGMPRELDEGELITMSPAKRKHGRIQHKLITLLDRFLEQSPVGEIYVSETGFLLSRDPATLRAPDVAFVRAQRSDQETPEGYLKGAPDLAVEVVSPSDTARHITRKVAQYLRHGGHTVWVVYPEAEEVHVFEASGGLRVLQVGQLLEAPELLPGFSVPVQRLFQ
jgi:Uma2 family endonuclease